VGNRQQDPDVGNQQISDVRNQQVPEVGKHSISIFETFSSRIFPASWRALGDDRRHEQSAKRSLDLAKESFLLKATPTLRLDPITVPIVHTREQSPVSSLDGDSGGFDQEQSDLRRNFEAIGEINKMDELRRRQEESNLNTIALLSSHIMSSAAISEANSKLTRTLAVAEQQKSSPSMKLKATDTRSLFLFYGAHNPMDLEPAWHHVDRDIRPALLFDMNLVGMTMEAAFSDMIGPDQPFLVALAEVLRRRKDLKASDIMSTFTMAPTSTVEVNLIKKMVTNFLQVTLKFPFFFHTQVLKTLKDGMIGCLQPIWFRDKLKSEFKNEYNQESCELESLMRLIINEATEEEAATRRIAQRGISSAHVATVGDTKPALGKSSTTVPRRLPANVKCWNCLIPGDMHEAKECPSPCRIHPTLCCPHKNRCCREAAGIMMKAHGPQVKLALRGSSISISKTSLPRSEASLAVEELDILIDTGANALCIHREDYFDGERQPSSETIAVANGKSVGIPGIGPVGSRLGKYLPDFDRTLVPTGIITDTSVIVINEKGMHIIPSTSDTVASVDQLVSEAAPSLSMFIPVVNGLFPISKSQLNKITLSPAERARLISLTDQSANSTYFTVKLDTIGEKVRFWHETWKHASKKDMIRIVRHKIFDDIPSYLTISAINRHFNDHCVSCKKATLRETSKPQESSRVYRVGEGCALDISYWTSDFSENKFCCHSLDLGSDKSWEDFLPSLKNLDVLIKKTYDRYCDGGYLLEFIRVDKSFVTEETRIFCTRRGIKLEDKEVIEIPAIIIEQPGPYEHAQNGSIECLIKCQVQDTNKTLDSAQILDGTGARDDRFWSKAMRWVSDTRNKLPAHGQLLARDVAWGLPKTSLRIQPLMPFGSRVLAHLPLKMQNNLSGRAIACYYLGPAPGIKGGILLHNIATGRTICRVSFKVMGQVDQQSNLRQPTDIEVSGEEGLEEYIYDELSHTVSRLSGLPTPGVSVDSTPGVPAGTQGVPVAIVSQPEPSFVYKSLRPADLPKNQAHYFQKIKMQFVDTSTNEKMIIVDVCLCKSIKRGAGSKTPYYKFYDVILYPDRPPDELGYEYMPCAEVMRSPEILWDDTANRATIEVELESIAYFAEYESTVPEEFGFVVRAYHAGLEQNSDPVSVAMRADFLDQKKLAPPKNLKQAREHPESEGYLGAWMREMGAHLRKGCAVPADMDIGDIPPDLILQLMPIFEKKYVGTDFSKFKCRMVVLGNHWKNKFGIDTFTTMVRMETIKFLIALGAIEDSDFIIIDVKEAFLTTKVNRLLPKRSILDPDPPDLSYYVRRPPGATDAEMPYIMKPEAFIYGHPLAGAASVGFGGDLKRVLVTMGCVPTNYDSSVYTLKHEGASAIIATAVDDMPTFINGSPELKEYIIRELENNGYELTVDDPMRTVLGIEVSRDRAKRTAMLRQRGQMENMLNEFLPDWATCDIDTLAVIPAQPRHVLGIADTKLSTTPSSLAEIATYNRKHGQLNWLLHTAPDFEQACNECSRHLKSPTLYDQKCIDQIISCMARIRRLDLDGLILGGTEGLAFISTVDSSYAPQSDLKSHTGGTVHTSHSTGAFMTLCKRQTVTADSAMTCEGLGAHMQIRLVLALRYFAEELGHKMVYPSKFYMDNEPFMKTITGQRGCSSRSRHVLIQWRILKEAYERDQIEMCHLNTVNMVADILTKPLPRDDWYRLRAVLLGHSPMVLDTAVLDVSLSPIA
jgi:hypothetical protein